MLRIISFFFFITLSLALEAQPLVIINSQPCPFQVTVTCGNINPPVVCSLCSVTVCVPPSTTITVPPCGSGCNTWTMATVCSVNPTCPSICAPAAAHCRTVSWNGCGAPAVIGFVPNAACTCAGVPVTINATTPGVLRIL